VRKPARFQTLPGSITAPQGFLAAGVYCDIKRLGTGKGSNKGKKRDLALIVSTAPASVAGVFTTNQVCAAPVLISLERAKRGLGRAIVVNSGNANACTGPQGLRDARAMTELTARRLKISPEDVLVCSTGRIGVKMPMTQVRAGIQAASAILNGSPTSAHCVAEAIMTSDTRPKEVAVEFKLGGRPVRVAGICKGAGMIQPTMSAVGPQARNGGLHATMLCFLTTDAAVETATLRSSLIKAVEQSFNRITVDGDMSTNDSAIILANGVAGNEALDQAAATASGRGDLAQFQTALNHVTLELAKMIVRDGEGASRFITIHLTGARTASEADAAARAVANSLLVKTSWCGGDPNWGRILDALGYSAARIAPEKVDVGYSLPGEKKVAFALKRGRPAATPFEALKKIVAQSEFDLHIDLHIGPAGAVIYTADLTEEYVDFNKGE